VEIIEVKDVWGQTKGTLSAYSVLWLEMKSKEDMIKIAETWGVPFIFKRDKDYVLEHNRIIYYFKE